MSTYIALTSFHRDTTHYIKKSAISEVYLGSKPLSFTKWVQSFYKEVAKDTATVVVIDNCALTVKESYSDVVKILR